METNQDNLFKKFFAEFSQLNQINDIGISVVKNEADIIESFVRYNLNFLDALIIMDDSSGDNTVTILEKLAAENLPLLILQDNEVGHLQDERMNYMLEKILNHLEPEIVIPLDADEFLVTPNQQKISILLKSLDQKLIPTIPWRSYLPNEKDIWTEPDPLRRITNRLIKEPSLVKKVILRKYHLIILKAKLNFGSHQIIYDKQEISQDLEPYYAMLPEIFLAHYPLRSIEQATSKVLVNWLGTYLRPRLQQNQGYHKKIMYEYIKKNMPLTYKDLEYLANNYLAQGCSDYIEDPIKIPYEHIKYPDLAQVDILSRVLSFTESLAEKIKTLAEIETLFKEI